MKRRYLLDTNICVFLFRKKYGINRMINDVGWDNCYISEITVAELWFGVECSSEIQRNALALEQFLQEIRIVPVASAIRLYGQEKARLRSTGIPIDDFDLLIGCSAVANDMVMVTDNERHFLRIKGIKQENWIQR